MGHTTVLDNFLSLHREQLVSSGIPQQYWEVLHSKLLNQNFDAGNTFRLVKIDYENEREYHEPIWGLQATFDIPKTDSNHIYLVDHAWTFRVEQAKSQLREYDALITRMCNLLGLEENKEKEQLIDEIFDKLWLISNTYSVGNTENVEDRVPVWYIMDEIGSAVSHSDTPNCRVVPFVYINEQITYSLLFPIEDIDKESLIFKDFAEGISDPSERITALLPWVPKSFEDVSIVPTIPGPDYFLSGHILESLPNLENLTQKKDCPKNKYKVFTEYNLIRQYLTDDKFELVDNEEVADILWYTRHFKNFKELSETPNKFVNQFPFEYIITVKDLLCIICRRSNKSSTPDWLPITYNLKNEIPNFVSYFKKREKENLENYWIIKPYNLARGIDTHVTNNLNYIMRLPVTGPKIAQKYIANPVLFFRPECEGKVKFDIRYVILLSEVKPLKAYVYNEFFLRFANKPFALNEFDVYEKHFTVMNYSENAQLKHMLCSEFKVKWEKQYDAHPWSKVQESIHKMLREILDCAIIEDPPCGIAENPQSRALYAADIMLDWTENKEIQPKILEINWTPDCQRACEYYPSFYNRIFRLLFCNEESDVFTRL